MTTASSQSMAVGVISEVTVALGFISPGYKTSVAFAILIVVFMLSVFGVIAGLSLDALDF